MKNRFMWPAIALALLFGTAIAYAQIGGGSTGYILEGPSWTVQGTLNTQGPLMASVGVTPVISTVAQLPTCNAAAKGIERIVSDATTPTFNGALTGSGAVVIPVVCNGTAWVSY